MAACNFWIQFYVYHLNHFIILQIQNLQNTIFFTFSSRGDISFLRSLTIHSLILDAIQLSIIK